METIDALMNLLLMRLDGAAFLLLGLPPDIQCDYDQGKERFLCKGHLWTETIPSSRPTESLEVYTPGISRLVTEAFPDCNGAARRGETFSCRT